MQFVKSSLLTLLSISLLVEGSVTRNRFRKDVGTNIVGGRPATQGEAPYQLTLQISGEHICGASLAEVEGVQIGITAAHCIFAEEISNYYVVAGDINLKDYAGFEQTRNVKDVIVHQNYSDWTLENDIAILILNGTFDLDDNTKLVQLPSSGQATTEGSLTVSGWGDLVFEGASPDDLQIVQIPLVSDAVCQAAYDNQISESMICAGSTKGDVSPCHGDSGGPAINDDGYLAGIVSWGYECGHPEYPAVFTEVSHFIDWIHVTVSGFEN